MRRVTTFPGVESEPHFSPDGQQIAFTGEYDGNTDVFVVSVAGGTPKRLTWHPGADFVRGWTEDGKILFASGRTRVPYQLWTVKTDGSISEQFIVPRAVNGVELDVSQNLFSAFDQTADKQIFITVNDEPTMEGARELTVVPVSNEYLLRQYDWVEGNRKKVDELSDGQLAYVWLPNTGGGGYANFNRYYFAQKDKKGAVIDERFKQGGSIADYIVDLLARDLLGYFNNPIGDRQPFTAPNGGIWGPKVMIINEMAGSGGDMMPYMFKVREIGPLVGTKTWGGLVGIWDVPQLIDNGRITAPWGGFYNVEGEWDVENEGVAPDVEVEQEAKLVIEGHDPQLEKAVEVALDLLKENPVELLPQPEDPVRVIRPEAER